MKLFFLFCLISFPVFSQTPNPWKVQVMWDYDEAELQTIDGFRVYFSTTPHTFSRESMVEVGRVREAFVQSMKSNTTYYFVATAFAGELESDYSNEIDCTFTDYRPKLRLLNNVLSFYSPPGESWLVEETNDFQTWGGLATGAEENGEVKININPNSSYRFFRARRLDPSPQAMLAQLTAAYSIVIPNIPLVPKKRFKHVDERKGAELLVDMLKEYKRKKHPKESRLPVPPMPGE